jgi:hypothetical protein
VNRPITTIAAIHYLCTQPGCGKSLQVVEENEEHGGEEIRGREGRSGEREGEVVIYLLLIHVAQEQPERVGARHVSRTRARYALRSNYAPISIQ